MTKVATCVDTGIKTNYCGRCGKAIDTATISKDANNHSNGYGDWQFYSCTQNIQYCKNGCGAYKTTSANNHIMQNVYHSHSGSSSSGGGCYGTVVYKAHSHTSSCYKTVYRTAHNFAKTDHYDNAGHIYYKCTKGCGIGYYREYWDPFTNDKLEGWLKGNGFTCKGSTDRVLNCGKTAGTRYSTEGVDYYELNCGKTTSTVEYSYCTRGCGYRK